ncbi:MAG: hypothetical protein JSV91_10465 [Phycisphaerales bacterium]|nr:MAG: hypothetical protein JSV91_10465 [Phycisphaerales bacterium]
MTGNCRLVSVAVSGALLISTGQAGNAEPVDVLLLGDGDAEYQVQPALEEAGQNVVFGGLFHQWDGVNPDVNDFDVVVYLDGWSYGSDLTPGAEAALAAFITGGGGLVITEWAAYDSEDPLWNPVIREYMPVTYAGDYDSGGHWFVLDPTHALTAWLPEQWGDAAGFSYVNVDANAAVVVNNNFGNPMITYRTDMGGAVVHLNHDMTYTTEIINPRSMLALINAVEYAGGATPADCNENGLADYLEFANGLGTDINQNQLLDECEDCNENGIPDEVDIDALLSAPTEFEFDGIVEGLDWLCAGDESFSQVTSLPVPVTLGGETFVAFTQDSNGYVELLRAGEQPYHHGYGYVDELVNYTEDDGPTHTFLMAAFDDLTSEEYGLFGYRLEADLAAFYWNTETYSDVGGNLMNEFEIVLFTDGTVQWNFNTADYAGYDYDLFSGVYLGYDSQTLIEVASGMIPAGQSWEFEESVGTPQSIPFEFTEVAGDFDWRDADDEGHSGVTSLPFSVTLGGETFVAFLQYANGYVELLRGGEDAYYYGHGSVDDLVHYTDGVNPTHTYLMAAYDDLCSYWYGLFGYRLDADRAVFYWNTETYDDNDDGLLNDFQIILFPDGTVRWDFNNASYHSYDYDLYSGIYLGHGIQELYEIVAGWIPVHESWLFHEDGVIGGGSSDDNDNGIPDECEDDCPEDLNDDDKVNIDDLFAILGAWGFCDDCPEDLNDDGKVNIDDLFLILGAWGPCP